VPRGIVLFIVLVVLSLNYLRETEEFPSSRALSFHNSFMVASHQITCLHPRDHLLPSSKQIECLDHWLSQEYVEPEDEFKNAIVAAIIGDFEEDQQAYVLDVSTKRTSST